MTSKRQAMRALLVKSRTMQRNQVRGLSYEFGVTFRTGRKAGLAEIRQRMDEIEQTVPGSQFEALRDRLERINRLDKEIEKLESRLVSWQKQEDARRKLTEIPGRMTRRMVAKVNENVMSRQDGPQERKPNRVLALAARATDEDVLGEFHQGQASA